MPHSVKCVDRIMFKFTSAIYSGKFNLFKEKTNSQAIIHMPHSVECVDRIMFKFTSAIYFAFISYISGETTDRPIESKIYSENNG